MPTSWLYVFKRQYRDSMLDLFIDYRNPPPFFLNNSDHGRTPSNTPPCPDTGFIGTVVRKRENRSSAYISHSAFCHLIRWTVDYGISFAAIFYTIARFWVQLAALTFAISQVAWYHWYRDFRIDQPTSTIVERTGSSLYTSYLHLS